MRVSFCCMAVAALAFAGCQKQATPPPPPSVSTAPSAAPAPAKPPGPPVPGDQDPARLAAAQDLLTAMKYRETMMSILEDYKSRLQTMIQRNTMMMPMGDATPAQVADLRKRMLDTWWAGIHPDELMAGFAKMYARLFSADDLQTMATFYRTHAGQELVKHTLDMPKESGKILNPEIQAAIPKMLQMQKDFLAAHPAKNQPRGKATILPPGLMYHPAPQKTPPPSPVPLRGPPPAAPSAAPSSAPSSS